MKKAISILLIFLSLQTFGQSYYLSAHTVGQDSLCYQFNNAGADSIGTNPCFVWDTIVPANYTDITSITNLDLFYFTANIHYCEIRNEMVSRYISNWYSHSLNEKQILCKNFVYPASLTSGQLDSLYTSAQRIDFLEQAVGKINICPIGNHNVTKRRASNLYDDIRADSDGVLNLKELKTDLKIDE